MNFNEIKDDSLIAENLLHAALLPYLKQIMNYVADTVYDDYMTYGIDVSKVKIIDNSVYVATVDGYDVTINPSFHKKHVKYDLQFFFKTDTQYPEFLFHFLNIIWAMHKKYNSKMRLRFVNITIQNNREKPIVWKWFRKYMENSESTSRYEYQIPQRFVPYSKKRNFFVNRIHFNAIEE